MDILFFLKPKLIREIIAEAEDVLNMYEENISGEMLVTCIPLIRNQLLLIKKSRKSYKAIEKSMIRDKITPEIWVHRFISNVVFNAASSGEYHLTRGVLNPMKGADTLPTVFFFSQKRLKELGDITLEQCNENRVIFLENIDSVG